MKSPPPDGKPDYMVGYARPPVHTRFRQGNSANPRGRPRGARNLKTLLYEALETRVAVTTEGGKQRRLAKRELGIARLADRFAAGDPPAIKLLLALLLELERRTPTEPAERPVLEEADRLVIESLLARLRAS